MNPPDAVYRWTALFEIGDINNTSTIGTSDITAAWMLVLNTGIFTATEIDSLTSATAQAWDWFINSGANTNGRVTLTQFLATAMANVVGKPQATVPESVRDAYNQAFQILDRTQDGLVTPDKVNTLIGATISESVIGGVFDLFEGPIDSTAAAEYLWTWLSSPVAQAEDSFLSVVYQEVQAKKLLGLGLRNV
eukprot:Phypoly_transcript_17172.p1 GENE.Phypoly_transcript_17172~~Phypoly_transcript_17172.p1  ORF type:complete len:192 (+),score=32.00 Phypoly_transcript_17172:213-788(+)